MRRMLLLLMAVGCLGGKTEAIRFLHWSEVQPVLAGFPKDKLPELPDIKDPTKDGKESKAAAREAEDWLKQRNGFIRGRIEQAVGDSISATILFGSSFTSLPALPSPAAAVNPAGDLTPAARARVDAFVEALDQQEGERLSLALEYLRRQRVPADEAKAFLAGNLRRYAIAQSILQKTRKNSDDAIPPEASLMTDFAIESALKTLKDKGEIKTHIRRIAVIGPGLDHGGKGDGFDFLPVQTVQPFAVMESVLRLGLAQPSEVQVTAFDLNPWVLAQGKSAKAKSAHYVVQVGHPAAAAWNDHGLGYWQHFGDIVGQPATAAQAPSGIELRAIEIKPQFAARVSMEEMDIVTQTLDGPTADFDLVIATNVLEYYAPWEQGMAMFSIARMMNHGGIFLINNGASVPKLSEFEPMGTESVAFHSDGSGDSITIFRRR